MIRIQDGLAVQYKQNKSENSGEFIEFYSRLRVYDYARGAHKYQFQVSIYKSGTRLEQHLKINSLDIAKRFRKLLKHEPVGPLNWPLHTKTRDGRPILEIIAPRNDTPAPPAN